MVGTEVLTADAMSAFAAFARHRNFTRAAEDLHVAQPSLHAKITKLGRTLGVALYERDGRGLRLTAAGEELAAFAADQLRAADDFLTRLEGPARPLRLVAGRAAIQWVLDEPLRHMVAAGTRLRVTPADGPTAIRLVERGDADVAAVGYDPPPRHLESRHLRHVTQVLVAPDGHPLVSVGPIRVADLDGAELIVPTVGRPHRTSLERALAAAGVTWTVASEADGWDLIAHLASLGVGLAVINDCIPVPPGLRAVEVTDLPPIGYWLTWRRQRQALVEPLLRGVAAAGDDRVPARALLHGSEEEASGA